MHATPEAAVRAQIGHLAGVAEDEAVATLPMRLAAMRIQSVAMRAGDTYVLLVLLLERALLLQERETLVLLFVVVVADLAVSAVDARLCARVQMVAHMLELELRAALTGDLAVWTTAQVLQSLLVRHDTLASLVILVERLIVAQVVDVRAAELLRK